MKKRARELFQVIRTDTIVTTLMVTIILLGIAYCVYLGLSIKPRDLQVAIQYTSFGPTNLYKEKWYYLFSFVIFGLFIVISHIIIMIKMMESGRRQLAVMFGYLTLVVLVLAIIITRSVLGIAAL